MTKDLCASVRARLSNRARDSGRPLGFSVVVTGSAPIHRRKRLGGILSMHHAGRR
jgi:hypothetical protein